MLAHYEAEFGMSGDLVSVTEITEDCDKGIGGCGETGALARPSGGRPKNFTIMILQFRSYEVPYCAP